MASDLIQRAADRIRQRQAKEIGEATPRPIEPAGSRPALQPTAPDTVMPSASHVDAGRQSRVSRPVSIDLGRLRRMGMVTPNGEATRIAEEFRVIKRQLLLKAVGDADQRVDRSHLIMVTSARPSEGKTFVTLNLAMSIAAERNLHVLLVDADFQNPSVLSRLDLSAENGFIDVVADPTLELADVLLRSELGNLTILPAGNRHPQSTELLASKRMNELMAEITQRYTDRIVLFDTPPALASSEPGVLALHVGQVVFVVEAERTSRRAIEEALPLISGCADISLLLNRRRDWFGTEQFGSYYGAYSR